MEKKKTFSTWEISQITRQTKCDISWAHERDQILSVIDYDDYFDNGEMSFANGDSINIEALEMT